MGGVVSATVKVALTPVAIVKDVVAVAGGDHNANATEELLASAGNDLEKAVEEIMPDL